MKLEIDPRAETRFNEIGEQVLGTVIREPRQPVPQNRFRPDVHITANLTERDIIGSVRRVQEILDGTGAQVGRFFDYSDHHVGLVGEAYQDLLRLLERIQRSGLQQTVSNKTLLETSFAWIERRYSKAGDEQLVPYLLQEIGQMVEEQELWIPLHRVYLERPVVIGSVRFETISKAMLDAREAELRKRLSPEDLPRLAERMERDRKTLQGSAAAVVIVTAEPTRAEELAREKSEQAVALLRFFSPANWHPEMRSYCTLLGDEDLRVQTFFRVKSGKLITQHTGGHDRRNRPDWFATPDVERFPGLLHLVSELADETKPKSDFQKRLLDAMLLYSRNSVAREPVDKLVYIFAALESMLLKNSSEPIQDNIALRVAHLVGEDMPSRKQIAATLKAVYSQRSSFVHHGLSIESAAAVSEFMVNAWTCFNSLMRRTGSVQSKDALIDQLDEKKFQ